MLSNEHYIKHSLEFNLFFLRIAKEHAIFLATSLPPKDMQLSRQAVAFKKDFERLLSKTVDLSEEVISDEVLASGEFVTELTLPAENATEFLTGIPINTEITKRELDMLPKNFSRGESNLLKDVFALNKDAITLTNRAINFMANLLREVSNCKAFSYVYPLMLDHVIRESLFAVKTLEKLQDKATVDSIKEIIQFEIMWTRIMDEHSKFIRGYLDPSENILFEKANSFAKEFDVLLANTLTLADNEKRLAEVTKQTIQMVTALRDFKKQGTEGILSCNIKSIILPLLGDHVLREANHYLRLLDIFSKM